MKPTYRHILILFCSLCFVLKPVSSHAQVLEIIKEAIIKVIKALDIQVQRLQNKTIELQNIQKEIENTLSKLKLDEIANWTQKQKEIYEKYFDELWKVKSLIAYYRRITEIIDQQKQLITEYKRVSALIKNDKHFSSDEIDQMQSVYTGIIDKSIESLDQILLLVESFTVQMSDADRLQLLNQSADEIETYVSDLRRFTNRNIQLSLQRAKNLEGIESVKDLYGLK